MNSDNALIINSDLIIDDDDEMVCINGTYYLNGRAYDTIYGMYIDEFDTMIKVEPTINHLKEVLSTRLKRKQVDFIFSVLNDKELIDLAQKVSADLNNNDIKIFTMLKNIFTDKIINNSYIQKIGDYAFLFQKKDKTKITQLHLDSLTELVESGAELHNPVYVNIDKDGDLLID